MHGRGMHPFINERPCDGLGHGLGALPHGIVKHHGFSFGFLLAPFHIGIDNFCRILSPDNAVVRTDGINGKAHLRYLFHQFENERGVKKQNVREIFFGVGKDTVADLVVKFFRTRVMLAEGIAGKKQFILIHIGEHTVRPMKHPGFQESDGSFAQ